MSREPPLFTVLWRPRPALPIRDARGRLIGHAFPPDIALGGQRDIREDDVPLQHLHGVRIRLLRSTRSDAEEAVFRVDGVEAAIATRFDPGNVFADGGHLPAL